MKVFKFVFQIRDHLGSVWVTFCDVNNNWLISANEILEERNYDPFGFKYTGFMALPLGCSLAETIEYNSREFEEFENYNMNEMDWRHYDPAIGRFGSIDKLAEVVPDFSPYAFAYNSPNVFSDGTGLLGVDFFRNSLQNVWVSMSGEGDGTSYTIHNFVIESESKWVDSAENNTFDFPISEIDKTIAFIGGGRSGGGSRGNVESIGQPGKWESIIPVWGSGRAAVDHFQNGNWGQGIFYTALAVSDLFLVSAVAKMIAKGTITIAANYAMRQSVKNPIMTINETRAMINTPAVEALMRGKGVDRAFRLNAEKNWILNPAEKIGIIGINPMNRGADMIGKGLLNGTWWDVTTKGSWALHVKKYGSGGIGLFY